MLKKTECNHKYITLRCKSIRGQGGKWHAPRFQECVLCGKRIAAAEDMKEEKRNVKR